MSSITSPRSNLLYHQDEQEDSYFSTNKPSYYKRSNLLVQSSTSSFRQKYKGFRTRSSSYTSLDDKNQNDGLLNYQDIPPPPPTTTASNNNTSLFSRKRLVMTAERSTTAPASYFLSNKQNLIDYNHEEENEDYENGDSEENTFFAKKNSYSRQNLSRSSSSWKSCVLRAVGVKSR